MSHVHRSNTSHTRSVSNYSRSTSHLINSTDELSDAGLVKQVTDLKYHIKILQLENEIFEKTIMRLEPSLMNGVQQAIEYANKIHTGSSLGVGSFVRSQTSRFAFDSLLSPSRMLTSPSKISTRKVESSARVGGTVIFGSGPRINVLERSELVSAEMEIILENLELTRRKAAKKHALLKAQLEELGVKVADVEKATVMFNQMVVVDGWDKIAQRIPTEIWVRFMTEWVKMCDDQIGKLRLRTSTLNTQFSKLKGQIKVKAELSEHLRPVDFEKMKIENQEILEAIDRKLIQLGELKKMTGDANLTLTIHKKAMLEQNNYLTGIIKSIKQKEQLTVELDKERDVIQVQADALAEKLRSVKKVRLAYEVPDIMDYVCVKSELTDLKHAVKLLENRNHIQQIALSSLNRRLNSVS